MSKIKTYILGGSMKKYAKPFICNFIIAFFVFFPFMIQNSGLLTLCDDFNVQQIPLNILSNNAIKNGNLHWTWNVDVGSSFIGATSFYVTGSPFFYLSLLFPAKIYPYLVGWLFMLKYAVAGLTSYAYIQRYCKNEAASIIGSVLYAFSGFQATNMLFFHFHDVVAFFPLMLLGLDKLVEDKKKGWFAASVCLCAWISFYFFIGEVIFVIIYFIVKYLFEDIKNYKKIVPCFVEGIIGVMMAMAIFLPTIIFNSENPRTSIFLPLKNWFTMDRRYLLNVLRAFLLPADNMKWQSYIVDNDFSSWSAYLPMISIVPTFLYIFKNKKESLSRLLIVLGVFCIIPILNSVFYLCTANNYHRWYNMLTLLMALASAKVFEEKEKYHLSVWAFISAFMTLLLYIGSIWWNKNKFQMIFIEKPFNQIFIICIAGLLLTALFDFLLKKSKHYYWIMLVGISVFAMITNIKTVVEYKQIATHDYFDDGNMPSVDYYQRLLNFMNIDNPDDAYRFHGTDNTAFMVGDISGSACFLSTINGSLFEFHSLTTEDREVFSPYENDGLDEIFSAKYYISEEKTEIEPLLTVESNNTNYYVYEKDNILPIGFGYDSYVTRSELETYEKNERLFIMLQALVIQDEDEAVVSETLSHFNLDTAILSWDKLKKEWTSYHKEASTEFIRIKNGFKSTVTTDADKYIFYSVPYDKGFKATVNNQKADILNINGLMAVKAVVGTNEIVFKNTNYYFYAGILLSITGIGLLIFWKRI